MNDKIKSIRENVLAKIKTEQVSMHSRAYFAAKLALLALVAFAVLVISIFLFNFILFAIHESGSDELLSFGNRGLFIFLRIFPWWLLALDILLVVALEFLLRNFRFGYKSPVLYLLVGLVIVTAAAGILIERTTVFNNYLRDRAYEDRLPPPLNNFYGHPHRPPGGPGESMCRCTVVSVEGNRIYVDDIDVDTTTRLLILVPQTAPNATTTGLSAGDVIFVAGDRNGNTIEAFGIRKLPAGTSVYDLRPRHGGGYPEHRVPEVTP